MSNSLTSQNGNSPFIYTQGAGLVNGIQLWWGTNTVVSCFTLECARLEYRKQFGPNTQTTIVQVPNSVDYFFTITSTDNQGVISAAAHFNKLSAGFAPDCISQPSVQVFSSFNATVTWHVNHVATQQVIAAYLVTAVQSTLSTVVTNPSFTVHPWCSTLNFRGYPGYYKFIIQALGSGSAYSSDLVMTDVYNMGIPPLPIINVRLLQQTNTTFSISWMGALTATDYIFTLAPDNGAEPFTVIPDFFDGYTPAYFTSCDRYPEYYNAPNYYLTITAVNDGGTTDSDPILIRFGPQAAYNVSFSSITSSSFTLTWQGAEKTDIFKFSLDSGSTLMYTSWFPFPYGVSTSGHAIFKRLPIGAKYSGVIIYACNFNSTIVARSLPPYSSLALLPGDVTAITPSLITQSSFTISWTGGQGASTFAFSLAPTVLSTFSATYRGLQAGTYYSTSITPINGTGAGASSTIVVKTVAGPVTGLGQGLGAYKTLLITWSTIAFGADYYRYFVNTATGFVRSFLSSVSISGLNPNTTYSVSIVSYNRLWSSLVGSTVSRYVNLRTGPVLPAFSVTKLDPSSFRVTWTAVSSVVYVLSGAYSQNNVISPLTISSLATFSTYMLGLAATNGFGSSVSSFVIKT
jgi:hypothetical protein